MENEGLREKKKRTTRRSIADVASGLFIERGFENVTIAEVAAAAEVAKKTVTNYFPRKEDLFLDRQQDRLDDIEAAIRARAAGESVLTALRRYQHELLESRHPLSGVIENITPFFSIVRASPALTGRWRELGAEMEEHVGRVLADELADELSDGARARLVGAAIGAALNTIFTIAVDRMLRGDALEEVRRDQPGVIDSAFDLLEGGIGGYGTR